MSYLFQCVQITFFKNNTKHKSSNNYTAFVSIAYVQRFSEPIKHALTQSRNRSCNETAFYVVVCCKPKDVICDEKKCGLVCEIACRDCEAVVLGKLDKI